MKNILKKMGVLLGIFIVAVVIYFIWEQKSSENKGSETVYTSLDEATLPVVSVSMFGKSRNLLHGYLQDMGRAAARESLTILPEDRMLSLRIDDYGQVIRGIRYEIRSLDLERLVERTELRDWNDSEEGVTAVLPIQNLLNREQEYLLDLCIDTDTQSNIHYYTRILWTSSQNVEAMLQFAEDFSSSTFDPQRAGHLVTYLEPNSLGDNSSLARVTIHSTFSQITWGGVKMKPVGEMRLTLKELNGIMAEVQVDYLITREGEEKSGEFYEVSDHFTMKWSTQRIYLMDYTRETNQIFSGSSQLFSGKRILLGIINEDKIRQQRSPNKQQIAFVVNRDLWCYNQEKARAVKIFSFRSGKDDGIRSAHSSHDMKIVSVGDNGNVVFLIYGYMNRGLHEGRMGVALYEYLADQDVIQEKFFAPVSMSYEALKLNLERLTYLGNNGMIYILVDQAVYGIDLNSNESMVVADSLRLDTYAVSEDGRQLAWQEGSDPYSSHVIHIMNLNTGKKQEITGDSGDFLRVLGFVGSDFIYGLARDGDQWVENERFEGLPMYALEILGNGLELESRYQKDGIYISSVEVQGSRIHINQVTKSGDHVYDFVEEDTLVCNVEVEEAELEGVGWYTSQDREKLYFVQLDQEVKSGRGIHVSAPGKVSAEAAGELELKANTVVSVPRYYAYGGGRLLGITEEFPKAVELAYERMGLVTDGNQRILWNRVNRSPARTIKDPAPAASRIFQEMAAEKSDKGSGLRALSGKGLKLGQVLYFIDKGHPVIAYTGGGGYLLISGYDQYNVTLFDPAAGDVSKMGLNDAASYFNILGNDFVCGITVQ